MINNSLAGNKIETLSIEEGIKTLGSGTEIFLANHKIKFPTSKERDTHEGPRGSQSTNSTGPEEKVPVTHNIQNTKCTEK